MSTFIGIILGLDPSQPLNAPYQQEQFLEVTEEVNMVLQGAIYKPETKTYRMMVWYSDGYYFEYESKEKVGLTHKQALDLRRKKEKRYTHV